MVYHYFYFPVFRPVAWSRSRRELTGLSAEYLQGRILIKVRKQTSDNECYSLFRVRALPQREGVPPTSRLNNSTTNTYIVFSKNPVAYCVADPHTATVFHLFSELRSS